MNFILDSSINHLGYLYSYDYNFFIYYTYEMKILLLGKNVSDEDNVGDENVTKISAKQKKSKKSKKKKKDDSDVEENIINDPVSTEGLCIIVL